MKTIWYGFSQNQNRVLFFDTDVGQNSSQYGQLQGYGSFTVNSSDTSGIQIESVRQTETTR